MVLHFSLFNEVHLANFLRRLTAPFKLRLLLLLFLELDELLDRPCVQPDCIDTVSFRPDVIAPIGFLPQIRKFTEDPDPGSSCQEAQRSHLMTHINTRYRQLSKTVLPEEALTTIREATNKGWALGNDRFRLQIEAMADRRATPLPRGRPRKIDYP